MSLFTYHQNEGNARLLYRGNALSSNIVKILFLCTLRRLYEVHLNFTFTLVNRIWTYPGASLDTPVCTAQFGEMVAWNTLSPNLSCNTCDWRAVHMEALILASNLTKWVLTRYNQEQRWKCISEKFPFKPSCSSAGGWAMLSFATFINRWSNFCATYQKRCWLFGHSITSRTLLLNKFLQKTPGSATIAIMPRLGETLEVTNHNEHSYRLSPFTPNQRTRRCNTINGGATISDRHRHRREISEGEERGVLKIYLSIPNFRSEQKKRGSRV